MSTHLFQQAEALAKFRANCLEMAKWCERRIADLAAQAEAEAATSEWKKPDDAVRVELQGQAAMHFLGFGQAQDIASKLMVAHDRAAGRLQSLQDLIASLRHAGPEKAPANQPPGLAHPESHSFAGAAPELHTPRAEPLAPGAGLAPQQSAPQAQPGQLGESS